jgi:hypothetical protein
MAALAVNVSLGGLYLDAAPGLPVGSPCDVAIFMPDGSDSGSYVAQGRIVRTGAEGTAIQFASMLGEKTLDAIARPGAGSVAASIGRAYTDYFKVSQSRIGFECERVFGVTRRTFKTVTTASFLTSIPAAILPVYALRAHIPDGMNGLKIVLAFAYGALWLLVLQPFIDLAVLRALKTRAARRSASNS